MIKVQLTKSMSKGVELTRIIFFSIGEMYTPLISKLENNTNDKLQLSNIAVHRQLCECFMV